MISTMSNTNNRTLFFSSIPLWEDPAPVLQSGRVGLLCNQTAWHEETGEYLFETLYKRGVLKRVFMPEAGNEKAAIELLAGDPLILDYIKGEGPKETELQEYFRKNEEEWIEKTRRYRLYEEPLQHIGTKQE
jgi:hypothetical protein